MESLKNEDCYPKAESTKTETKKSKVEKSESEEKKLKEAKDILNSIIKSENDGDKSVRNQVLKRKFTEDGATIERVLSEGETSSGFETVSSINFNDIDDIDDLELSSLNDSKNDIEENFNVIVQIENELAYRNKKAPEKRNSHSNYYTKVIHDYKNDDNSSSERSNSRLDKDRRCRTCRDGNCKHKYYKRSNRDRWSSEREISHNSRRPNCHRERYSPDWKRRLERRSGSRSSRSRHSKSSESTFRYRNSRTPERKVRRSSYSIKDRKAESRHSGSFDKYSSNRRRNSPLRKRRRRSFSRSPSSVWSRLDSHSSPSRDKKEKTTNKRSSGGKSGKKRSRTPFLVELERKLKEANRSKKDVEVVTVSDTVPMLQVPPVVQQNLNPLCRLALPTIPVFEGLYHFHYQPIPNLSVNNLPLVPGPTGLPVHVTPTGEQIPHDMDGRPIPVGPNGFYLPVDPTGRLFPHIISPLNQAIPIHMTDDGVLRLPDSEPVPYGPNHQLPVNIDGTVIYIGPDSKPLFPCPNLPRSPPLHLINRLQQPAQGIPQMGNQQVAPVYPVQLEPQPPSISDNFRTRQLEVDLITLDATQTSPDNEGVEDPPEKQKQTETEKAKKDLMDTERDNSLDADPSVRAVKRPIPLKLLQGKVSRNNVHSDSPEIILESNDSVPAVKTASESAIGSNQDDAVIQEEEQSFLEIVCDYKSLTIPIAKLSSDDPIVRKTEHAIKSLSEKNYKAPVFGRFIVSDLSSGLVARKFPNESPLFRNRIKLPFVTPNAKDFYHLNRPVNVEKTKVTFKFLPQKSEKGERLASSKYNRTCYNKATKLPVLTVDFAVQCDFTSVIIRKLKARVGELETEVVRLRKANANLLVMNEKKSDELRKALSEIQERNSEILALKCPLKVQQ